VPTYLLEFSRDDLSDITPTWIDITPYFLAGSYRRGHGVLASLRSSSVSTVTGCSGGSCYVRPLLDDRSPVPSPSGRGAAPPGAGPG
jgi:hypothetical protein